MFLTRGLREETPPSPHSSSFSSKPELSAGIAGAQKLTEMADGCPHTRGETSRKAALLSLPGSSAGVPVAAQEQAPVPMTLGSQPPTISVDPQKPHAVTSGAFWRRLDLGCVIPGLWR